MGIPVFRINVEFNEGDFRNQLERATVKSLVSQVQQRVGSVQCATHEKTPTVRVQGTTLKTLNWKIEGCCEQVIEQVRAKLPTK
jgi:hypothetical protein